MVIEPRGDRARFVTYAETAAAALIAGFVSFALARGALLPGLGFWDTGELQVVAPVLGTAHPTGFPAFVILGWLASIVLVPFGDPAFRMNALSALLVGGATALTVVFVRQLTGRLLIALGAGLLIAAVPVVWNIGTHADAHALHVVLVALVLLLLVGWERRVRGAAGGVGPSAAADRVGPPPSAGPPPPPAARAGRLAEPGDRWLLAAAIAFGVALANHTLTLLLAPGIGLFLLATYAGILNRPRFIVGLAGALFGTALLLYLELPLRAGLLRAPLVYGHPETLDGFLYEVLGEQFLGAVSQPFSDLGGKIVDLARFGYDQLGLLAALIPAAFIVTVRREPRYALLTGVIFLITVWFAASYFNADISRYYLGPAVIVVSWLALLATEFAELIGRLTGMGKPGAPRGVAIAPQTVARLGKAGLTAVAIDVALVVALLIPTLQALPERASAADLTNQREASEWEHAAFSLFEPNAVVVSWWSYSTTLWYGQIIEGQRPDVWIVDDRTRLDENLGEVTDVIDAYLATRPVYVVRLPGDDDMAAVEAGYDLEAFEMPTEQPVHKVLGRKVP